MNNKICFVCQLQENFSGVHQSLCDQTEKIHAVPGNWPLYFQENLDICVNVTGIGLLSVSLHAIIMIFIIIEDCANPNSPGNSPHTVALLLQ